MQKSPTSGKAAKGEDDSADRRSPDNPELVAGGQKTIGGRSRFPSKLSRKSPRHRLEDGQERALAQHKMIAVHGERLMVKAAPTQAPPSRRANAAQVSR